MIIRDGTKVADYRLGRVAPKDWAHVEKYPLRVADLRALSVPMPVPIGVNWYSAFYADKLVQRRHKGALRWFVAEGDLGPLRGGHALVLEPATGPHRDAKEWWWWHDQVSEGICVSEAVTRMGALLNRKRYQPRPLYDLAQTLDEWEGEGYSGTSVNAGLAVARLHGLIPRTSGEAHKIQRGWDRPFVAEEGIAANRWITGIDDLLSTLGDPNASAVPWLNSWGTSYPQRVYVPVSVLARLHSESGEFGVVTDR